MQKYKDVDGDILFWKESGGGYPHSEFFNK
jgi:hypothetical protein